MSSPLNFDFDPLYPESDGKPMADSTLQFDWISIIKWGLDKELKNPELLFSVIKIFKKKKFNNYAICSVNYS